MNEKDLTNRVGKLEDRMNTVEKQLERFNGELKMDIVKSIQTSNKEMLTEIEKGNKNSSDAFDKLGKKFDTFIKENDERLKENECRIEHLEEKDQRDALEKIKQQEQMKIENKKHIIRTVLTVIVTFITTLFINNLVSIILDKLIK